MKKIIALMMVFVMMVVLCSCGNKSYGLGNYNYEKVHIDSYHYSGCLTIKNWHDDEMGIEVKTKEAGSLFLSEGTYFLIEGECPFCKGEER